MASAGAFTFKVLVGMRNVPADARSVSIAERILGASCASIEIALPEVVPEEDDHELFVTAWCIHPRLVPDEKIMSIPEPLLPEALEDMTELPALRYLVRCRVVEFQDWLVTRHTSDDDNGYGRPNDDDDDDSGDSNHNRYHPCLDRGGPRSSLGTKSVRLAGAGDDTPSLGNERGPTFRSRRIVLVGSFACLVVASHAVLAAMRWCPGNRTRLAGRRWCNGLGLARSMDPSSQSKTVRRHRTPLTPSWTRSVHIARQRACWGC